jgi:hypothetical protein
VCLLHDSVHSSSSSSSSTSSTGNNVVQQVNLLAPLNLPALLPADNRA